jgi:hypothetical protein
VHFASLSPVTKEFKVKETFSKLNTKRQSGTVYMAGKHTLLMLNKDFEKIFSIQAQN